jgi:hypothetical protein
MNKPNNILECEVLGPDWDFLLGSSRIHAKTGDGVVTLTLGGRGHGWVGRCG